MVASGEGPGALVTQVVEAGDGSFEVRWAPALALRSPRKGRPDMRSLCPAP